ncbi:MAG: hypothetical protein ABSG31_10580 [Tepidisphaeraceae bacterium]
MTNSLAVVILAGFLALTSLALADAPTTDQSPTSLFDPAKDISVNEVHAGMHGYGLSVFSGTKIEKFDLDVIDVVHNFNPKYDAILVRCKGDFLEHTGAIEGMSGSPIFIDDGSGNARLAGAFAYGWPLSKDPIGGVQPIEYMLKLPSSRPSDDGQPQALGPVQGRWSLLDVWKKQKEAQSVDTPEYTGIGEISGPIRMEPLASPLIVGGFSAQAFARLTRTFAGTGLIPLQSGGSSSQPDDTNPPHLEPGSVLAVPLLTGDADMTAIGTCTTVVGDRMFGFGHPFFGQGHINLPMGAGHVSTVIANLESSFKLGFISTPTGALMTDQTVGVAGRIGAQAPMIPVEVHVIYDDKSVDETYHFQAALHTQLTPLIVASAVDASVTGEHALPDVSTFNYDLTMDFANGQTIHAVNTSVNSGDGDLLNDLSVPVTQATQNPFKPVALTAVHATVHVSDTADIATILSVMVPRSKYEPGETVKAYIAYQPFRATEATLPVDLDLPRNIPNGTYYLTVMDWSTYMEAEQINDAFKFTASNVDEMFDVLKFSASIRHNAVYLQLYRQGDGVAVGRTAMPRLPSSERQVLMDAGRSDIQPYMTTTLKVVPTDLVMQGSAIFPITIERKGQVEVAPPNAPAPPANAPAAPMPTKSAAKSDEPPQEPGK